ncbi:MAG: hypothetical protein WBB19_09990 [Desulforhopalus sp.]
METTQLTRQMIDFQKTLFDNSYNALTVIHNQNEEMINGFLKQLPWATEESKKPFVDSISFIKSARAEYKKSIDQGFTYFQELVDVKQEKSENVPAKKADSNLPTGVAEKGQPATVAPKTKQAVKG